MFITNLKIIVATDVNEKVFKALMKRLSDKAKKEMENVTGVAFPAVKEPYLHFENKFNIPFADLNALFMSEDEKIVFRAIGDEMVQVPGFTFKSIQVPLTPEQKEEVGTDMCKVLEETEQIEADKKEHSKQCALKIEKLDVQMAELATRFRRGYDDKEIKCVVQMDFATKVKNYLNEQTGEVIASEELQPSDFQMRIDYIPGVSAEVLIGEENTGDALPFPVVEPEDDELPM